MGTGGFGGARHRGEESAGARRPLGRGGRLLRARAARGRDAPAQGREEEEEGMEQDGRRAAGPQRVGVRTKAATKAGSGGGQGTGRAAKGQGGDGVGQREGGKPGVGRDEVRELEEVAMARGRITIKDYLFSKQANAPKKINFSRVFFCGPTWCCA